MKEKIKRTWNTVKDETAKFGVFSFACAAIGACIVLAVSLTSFVIDFMCND